MIDILESMANLYTKQHELAAIWLNMKVLTSEGFTLRIAKGDRVRFDGESIVDITDEYPANYTIVKCLGTPVNMFEFVMQDENGKVISYSL